MASTSSSKPTVILVPGAFHTATCFERLRTALSKFSYPTLPLTLPTISSHDPMNTTATTDTTFVRDNILSLIDKGKDVFLVMHSYGGIPGSAAARGLSKNAREGKTGVVGMVFISGIIAPDRATGLSMMGGVLPTYAESEPDSGWTKIISDPIPYFYSDLPAPLATAASASLRPQATAAFITSVPCSGWTDPNYIGHLGYIRCADDATIPASVQDTMMKDSGVEWMVREYETGHSPFLSVPDQVAETLDELRDILNRLKL